MNAHQEEILKLKFLFSSPRNPFQKQITTNSHLSRQNVETKTSMG